MAKKITKTQVQQAKMDMEAAGHVEHDLIAKYDKAKDRHRDLEKEFFELRGKYQLQEGL